MLHPVASAFPTKASALRGPPERKVSPLIYDQSQSVDTFLNAVAARQPTPGGGSVTALVGALAAVTGEMVLNYSLKRKDLEPFYEELKPALEQLTRARKMLVQLMVEDQAAYEALVAVHKLPADSPERAQQRPAALMAAIGAPQAMAATAVTILELADNVVNFVNDRLLSDWAICADLAMATTRCALYSVRINLKELSDPADRQRIEAQMTQVLGHAATLIQRVAPRIWERSAAND